MTRGATAAARGASLLLALVLGGCGQTGPLSLPGEAQPIQRVTPPAQPAQDGAEEPGDADATDEESPSDEPANER